MKKIRDGAPVSFKVSPTRTTVSYYWDAPEQEICDEQRVLSLMKQKLSSETASYNCEQYFCEAKISVLPNDTQQVIDDHFSIMNYCQYCKRSDFQSFHARVKSKSCGGSGGSSDAQAFVFPQYDKCSSSKHDGYPVMFRPMFQRKESRDRPYLCHCPYLTGNGAKFAAQCDLFSFVMIPLYHDVYPIFMLLCISCLLIISVVFYLIPFLVVRIKSLFRSGGDWKREIGEFFDTYVLITLFIEAHFVLQIVEYVFSLPVTRLGITRQEFGAGFFQSLGFILFLYAMFTLVVLWVNVLYKAKSKDNNAGLILPLKIVLLAIYLLLGSLSVVPFVSLSKKLKMNGNKLINNIFFPLSIVMSVLLGFGFAVYGIRLYLKIRETTKLSMFQLKFNRFMFVATALHLAFAFQMMFTTIENSVPGGAFGATYRYLNIPLLFITLMLLDIAFMYQTFRHNLVIEAYPCTKSLFAKFNLSRCFHWIKKKFQPEDDAESYYYSMDASTTDVDSSTVSNVN